ncbi:MAG: helix-hairpin-helix domain-containing protein [Acidobacteriaceae bacterium]|jgi:competence protein ComEA|nr:helix-hairpin-helix domain-containing protein [Acidobacteriaceae bacterium]
MRQSLLLVVLLFTALVSVPHAQSRGASSTATPSKSAPAKTAAASKPLVTVNLNTATVVELQALPGIGAKVAARIIEYRESKGPFKKIEELMNVQGIGEKSFLKLRPQLSVGGARPDTPQ